MTKKKTEPPVQTDQQKKIAEAERRMKEDPLLWGYYLFPHYFRLPSPIYHLDFLRSLKDTHYVVVNAPRGSAKSVVISWLYPFHCIFYKKYHYILLVSNTQEKANEHLKAIKAEFRDNDTFKQITNKKLVMVKDKEGEAIFRHTHDKFEIRVLCAGYTEIPKLRGTRFKAYRPGLIILDDVEDDEMCRSKERRINLESDFKDALLQSLDLEHPDYKVIVVGTILHNDSLLAKLFDKNKYPEFKRIFYKAYNAKYRKSLWPEKWSVESLEDYMKRDPIGFAQEMQGEPTSGKNIVFHKEDFRIWQIRGNCYELLDNRGNVERRGNLSDCLCTISCDLAWEEKRRADNSVLLAAYLTPDRDIMVDKYLVEKGLRPDKLANYLFEWVEKYEYLTGSNVPVCFEQAMLEKVSQWFLKEEMRIRNKYIIRKSFKWEYDKIKRIETELAPRYSNNTIYHRAGMGDLEYELIKFPYGATDDVIDALQGAVKQLRIPKKRRKFVEQDDGFKLLKEFCNPEPDKQPFAFGYKKNKIFTVPARKTFR